MNSFKNIKFENIFANIYVHTNTIRKLIYQLRPRFLLVQVGFGDREPQNPMIDKKPYVYIARI